MLERKNEQIMCGPIILRSIMEYERNALCRGFSASSAGLFLLIPKHFFYKYLNICLDRCKFGAIMFPT